MLQETSRWLSVTYATRTAAFVFQYHEAYSLPMVRDEVGWLVCGYDFVTPEHAELASS